mgnify:CR=1 FL=1
MGDRGSKDKGKKEQQKKDQLNPKEKRKQKKEKKKKDKNIDYIKISKNNPAILVKLGDNAHYVPLDKV